MNSPIKPTTSAELDWQAWLYVSGELDAAECAAFEARLLDDTAACEAVARAVELSDLMAAAATLHAQTWPVMATSGDDAAPAATPALLTLHSAPATAGWSQRLGWMAVGAAACLAVMLAGRGWQPGPIRDGEPQGVERNEADVAAVDDEARMLVFAWTELLNMDDALAPAAADDDAISSADSVLAATTSDEPDSAPPDWLLAAVADQADGTGLIEETGAAPSAPPQPN